jgi:hypothetical protein
MHEAGIARAIAETLRAEGLLGVPVRILVTGGHDEPSAFDSSLLFHLELAAPDVDAALLSLVHLPSGRWCPSCAHRFEAVGEADCPACGGATMASQVDELIEIEVADGPAPADGPGSSDPPDGAERPSGALAEGRHHEAVETIAVAVPHEHDHDNEEGHGGPVRDVERPDDRAT